MRKICQHILVCLSLGAIVLLTSCGGDQPSELKPAKPRTDSLLHGVWMAEKVNYVLYDMEEIENPNRYGFDYLPDSNVWIIDMHAGRIYGWKDGKAADYFTDFQLFAPSSKTRGMYGLDINYGRERATWYVSRCTEETLVLNAAVEVETADSVLIDSLITVPKTYRLETSLRFTKRD